MGNSLQKSKGVKFQFMRNTMPEKANELDSLYYFDPFLRKNNSFRSPKPRRKDDQQRKKERKRVKMVSLNNKTKAYINHYKFVQDKFNELLNQDYPRRKQSRSLSNERNISKKLSNGSSNDLRKVTDGTKSTDIGTEQPSRTALSYTLQAYMTKLISMNIWAPNQTTQKNHNCIIIFDWDDTLLPTSYIIPNGVYEEKQVIERESLAKIMNVGDYAYRVLKKAIDFGEAFIITNAAPGWVEFSCEKFFPSIKRDLLSKISVISARGLYERKYPRNSREWKVQTFLKMLLDFDPDLITNLICMGDSYIELEAGKILASKFKNSYIKTIKFKPNPKPEELVKELKLVDMQFDYILSAVKNLSVKVESVRRSTEKR